MKYFLQIVLLLTIFSFTVDAQWIQTNGPECGHIGSLFQDGSSIFAGTDAAGIFRSTDGGAHWVQTSAGITELSVHSITKSGTYLLATGTEGFYRSSDNGDTWNSVLDLPYVVNGLSVNNANVMAGTNGKGIFVSTDNGETWTAANTGLPFTGDRYSVTAMVANGSTFFMSATNNSTYGVYKTTDFGASWTAVNTGLPSFKSFYSFVVHGSDIFVGGPSVYKTTDSGNSWVETAIGLPVQPSVSAMLAVADTIYAGAVNGVYRSTNNGASWSTFDTLTLSSGVSCLLNTGSNLLSGTRGRGIFNSTDGGYTWGITTTGLIAHRSSGLIDFGTTVLAFGNGVYRTSDNGANWSSSDSGLPKSFYDIMAVAKSHQSIFLAVANRLYSSTDSGNVWSQITTGIPSFLYTASLFTSDSIVYLVSTDVYKSADDGANWTKMNTGLFGSCIIEHNNTLLVGTNQGVSRSTNNGTSWQGASTGLPNFFSVGYIVALGSDLYIGQSFGSAMYRSSNNGDSWTAISNFPSSNPVQQLYVFGNDLYGVGANGGIFITKNQGTTWTKISTGLPKTYLFPILAANGYIFSGTDGNGVWKRLLTDFTAVHEITADIPTSVSLLQNYPNPFNPTTNFEFSIANSGNVILKIFDVLGREIATLVNEELHPGTYNVSWDAGQIRGLPSGEYFARLSVGNFNDVKKLLLTK